MSCKTKSGDMWDSIAFELFGNNGDFVADLIRSNQQYAETVIFDSEVELIVPEITVNDRSEATIPPWKR